MEMGGDGRSAQDQGRGQGRELAPPLPRKQAGLGLTLLFQVDQTTQALLGLPPHTSSPGQGTKSPSQLQGPRM